MPRLGRLSLLLLFLVPLAVGAVPRGRIQVIVGQVRARGEGSFEGFMRLLPVDEGAERGYRDPGLPQQDLVETRQVILEQLAAALGRSQVTLQSFDADGCQGANIVGILPGRGPRRAQHYVLTAHYDSAQTPGADDNGTGVAGLLEAARVLATHRFDATLVFLATDQEEERERNGWGRGSESYATRAARARVDIRAVVALDMIGYNHQGSRTVTISRVDEEPGSVSHRLSNQVAQAFRDYTPLRITTRTGEDESDPYRFHQVGFPVVLVSEEFDAEGSPLNPYYHSPMDCYRKSGGELQAYRGKSYIDAEYAANLVRGVVGWAVAAAGLKEE